MNMKSLARLGLSAIAATLLISCADRGVSTAPAAAVATSETSNLLGLPILVQAVGRTVPLASDISASAVSGANGGSIQDLIQAERCHLILAIQTIKIDVVNAGTVFVDQREGRARHLDGLRGA